MYPKNLIHSQTHKSHDTPRFLMIGKCINLNDKCVNLPTFHTTTTTPPPLPLPDFEKLESLDKLVPDIPKIKRFVGKPNPMTFTKNWYSKPTSPDMQSEERLFWTQFFVSIDNSMNGILMVYLNKKFFTKWIICLWLLMLMLPIIILIMVKLLIFTIGFFGTLRHWWDKYLTEDSREFIKNSVKKMMMVYLFFMKELIEVFLIELILWSILLLNILLVLPIVLLILVTIWITYDALVCLVIDSMKMFLFLGSNALWRLFEALLEREVYC